ncbi:MAG: glycosyltransferase [Verrucomicrobiales bacterium]
MKTAACRMRILLINASDNKGGAAQVGWNVLHGLRDRGHEVELWAAKKSSNSEWVTEIPAEDKPVARSISARVKHRLGVNLDLESGFPASASGLEKFDAVHLHDLPAWNWRHFREVARKLPILWTIHSMAPFTGNCIYSYGCSRYRQSCGQCPQHGKWPLLWNHRDGSRLNLELKCWLTREMPIHLLGVSEWISDRCRESRLFRGKPVRTIQNAVDPQRFYRVDSDAARERLGIPRDARTVLISVAGNPLDDRKGIDLSIQALQKLEDVDLFLLPMGISGDSPELKAAFSKFASLPPRHVADDSVMRDYYSAADVVWHPSRADTSSMVSLEAFACGTPVIAAEVGGVPEVVKDGKGLLIPANDSDALASATRRFFRDESLQESVRQALEAHSAESEFRRMLDEHEETYQEVLGARI